MTNGMKYTLFGIACAFAFVNAQISNSAASDEETKAVYDCSYNNYGADNKTNSVIEVTNKKLVIDGKEHEKVSGSAALTGGWYYQYKGTIILTSVDDGNPLIAGESVKFQNFSCKIAK